MLHLAGKASIRQRPVNSALDLRSMSSEQSKPDPASLWSTLPKAISLVVSLSALGYFIGWRESNAFYEAAGAPWAAMSVPPAALLQQSSSTVLAIAFGAFFSLVLLIDNKVQTRKLTWFCAWRCPEAC